MKNIKLLGSGCRNCETTSGEMAMYHEHAVAKRGFSGLMDGVLPIANDVASTESKSLSLI